MRQALLLDAEQALGCVFSLESKCLMSAHRAPRLRTSGEDTLLLSGHNDPSGPQYFLPPTSGVAANGLPIYSWNQAAAQLTRESNGWGGLGNAAVVTFAFRSSAPGAMPDDTAGFQQFTAAQIALTEQILSLWSSVANITFVRVNSGDGYSNSATMLFANYTSGAGDAAAFAYYPGSTGSGSSAGDVWINYSLDDNNSNLVFGAYGAQIIAHEIGHAIGISHPADYDASDDQDPAYPGSSVYWQDGRMFSIMSYFGSAALGGSLNAFAGGPQLHDIAAAQRLYGANTTTRTGNTVYGFNSNTGLTHYTITADGQSPVFAIWDAGGNDTIDFSGFTTNVEIDLRPEAFSSAGPGNGGTGVAIGNISIARGVIIENAIGGGGNDTLIGNSAANQLTGNTGADSLSGGDGDDILFADSLDTLISGGAGIDWVYFQDNANVSFDAGSNSVEVVLTNAGADTLNGASHTTTFTVYAGAGADTITGGSGNDNLYGQDGNDTITGGNGNDLIWGEGGADSLSGGDGNDTFIADALDTLVSGGVGLDWVYFIGAGNVNLDAGANGFEVVLTTIGNDVVNATSQTAVFTVYASGGNDTITGGSSNDNLYGQDGADTIVGGGGNDLIWGEGGVDSLSGGDGDDTIIADSTDSLVSGGAGVDWVYYIDNGNVVLDAGARGIEVALTGSGADTLNATTQTANFAAYAGGGADTITGGTGNDGLFGQDGDDTIAGGNGNDVLLGEGGSDTLNGGAGGDIIAGGAGADTFVYQAGWGGDSVLDFQNGVDQFDMTALAANGVTSIANLTISTSGLDAIISWSGNLIVVQNAAGQIDSSDFIFGP